MKTTLKFSIVLFVCSIIVSCYEHNETPLPSIKVFAADSVNENNVSYNNYVGPLLKANCGTCHAATGSATPFWINDFTFQGAKRDSRAIVGTMLDKTMPPAPKFPFLERDRELLKAWLDNGCPE